MVISSPKSIGKEWRLFVAHDQVFASSQYADQGQVAKQSGCPGEVLDFAERILSEVSWRPDPLFRWTWPKSTVVSRSSN